VKHILIPLGITSQGEVLISPYVISPADTKRRTKRFVEIAVKNSMMERNFVEDAELRLSQ